MLSDNILLKLLGNRFTYFKYRHVVQIKALLERSVQIFKDIEAWFELNPDKKEVDWIEFSEWFRILRHPSMSEDDSKLYAIIFERINKTDLEGKTAGQILKNLVERAYAKKLTELGIEAFEGKRSVAEAQDILDEWQDQVSIVEQVEEDPDLISDNVIELLEDVYGEKSNGLYWPLKEMNISLGPLRTGNAVLLAAYVDSGKTSKTLFCTQHMTKQLPIDKQTIYFANEERGKGVKLRYIQSTLGWTSGEMQESFVTTADAYRKAIGNPNKFVLYYNPSMSTRYIEEKLRQHNPGLIIIDQLWNVSGFSNLASTNTDRYTELAKWARRIAAKAPCIFTHQADGTCNGVKYIEMHQLYGSKVGMQGAVDAVITLGRETSNLKNQFERGLYFPKNKLDGDKDVDPLLKNAKWDILIDPQRCRFKGGLK